MKRLCHYQIKKDESSLPAYIVLTNVSSDLIPIISEIGDTSNFAATLGIKFWKNWKRELLKWWDIEIYGENV